MEWREIPSAPGYRASDTGGIYSTKVHRDLRPGSSGVYLMVFVNGRQKRYVHHLIAEAFIGPRPQGQVVRHLDGNPLNNSAGNLGYGTYGDNERDKIRHGTHQMASRTSCVNGHVFDEENSYWNGKQRVCRSCRADRLRTWRAANPERRRELNRQYKQRKKDKTLPGQNVAAGEGAEDRVTGFEDLPPPE